MFPLSKKETSRLIDNALAEDRVRNDITTNSLVTKQQISSAYIITRQDGILCGGDIVKEIFKKSRAKVTVYAYHKDGSRIKKNEPVIFLKGNTRAILSCERVALNFLGHLCGIATLTDRFVTAVKPSKVKILDTRKTTPGLRDLEKYSVTCGGGESHRRDLSNMVLIKDNHLLALKNSSLSQTIKHTRSKTNKKIEIEIESLRQLENVLPARPDIVLLDNMSINELKKAVSLKRKTKSRVLLEASGGITLKNIKEVAKTGVDRISVGALTHAAPSLDLSLEFVV